MKTKIIGLVLVSLFFLNACHENPLKTHSKDKTARFLVQASQYAEEKARHPQRASGYFDCMRGKQHELDCNQLYVDMLGYARQQEDFVTLTVADLKDKKAFKRIQERYEERMFFVF